MNVQLVLCHVILVLQELLGSPRRLIKLINKLLRPPQLGAGYTYQRTDKNSKWALIRFVIGLWACQTQ